MKASLTKIKLDFKANIFPVILEYKARRYQSNIFFEQKRLDDVNTKARAKEVTLKSAFSLQ